ALIGGREAGLVEAVRQPCERCLPGGGSRSGARAGAGDAELSAVLGGLQSGLVLGEQRLGLLATLTAWRVTWLQDRDPRVAAGGDGADGSGGGHLRGRQRAHGGQHRGA